MCAALVVAGCSAEAETGAAAGGGSSARAAALPALVLPDDVTAPKGLVRDGEPAAGVRKLVECPDLASAGQATAGVTARWTWARGGREVTMTQYNAVYSVPGKDVVKQARAASNCHRAEESLPAGEVPTADEYLHLSTGFPTTGRAVDERYAYCVTNPVRQHSTCTGLMAKGDKIVRLTVDGKGDLRGVESPAIGMFAQALADRLDA